MKEAIRAHFLSHRLHSLPFFPTMAQSPASSLTLPSLSSLPPSLPPSLPSDPAVPAVFEAVGGGFVDGLCGDRRILPNVDGFAGEKGRDGGTGLEVPGTPTLTGESYWYSIRSLEATDPRPPPLPLPPPPRPLLPQNTRLPRTGWT
jgi:hypothetical protein